MRIMTRDGLICVEPKCTFYSLYNEEINGLRKANVGNDILGDKVFSNNFNIEEFKTNTTTVIENLYEQAKECLDNLEKYNRIVLELMNIYRDNASHLNKSSCFFFQSGNDYDNVSLKRIPSVDDSQNFSVLIKEIYYDKLNVNKLSRPSKEALENCQDTVRDTEELNKLLHDFVNKCDKPYLDILVSATFRLDKHLRIIESILCDMSYNSRNLFLYKYGFEVV